MKPIIPSLTALILVAAAFIGGLLTGATALTMAAFCAWSPALLWFGVALGRSGLRVALVADKASKPALSPAAQPLPRPTRQRSEAVQKILEEAR